MTFKVTAIGNLPKHLQIFGGFGVFVFDIKQLGYRQGQLKGSGICIYQACYRGQKHLRKNKKNSAFGQCYCDVKTVSENMNKCI